MLLFVKLVTLKHISRFMWGRATAVHASEVELQLPYLSTFENNRDIPKGK